MSLTIEIVAAAQAVEGGKIYRAWIGTPTDTGMAAAQRAESHARKKVVSEIDGHRLTAATVVLPQGSILMTAAGEYFAVREAAVEGLRHVTGFTNFATCRDGHRHLVLHGASPLASAKPVRETRLAGVAWLLSRPTIVDEKIDLELSLESGR